MDVHSSSSHEHQAAEALALEGIRQELGVADLAPARLQLGDVWVELDGWSPTRQVAVEIYARVTAPKGGAVKKPMDDAMRLLLVRHHFPRTRLALGFAAPIVADHFRTGKGWRAAALEAMDIGVHVVPLDGTVMHDLAAATKRQYR